MPKINTGNGKYFKGKKKLKNNDKKIVRKIPRKIS
jgi:hypothetical protein